MHALPKWREMIVHATTTVALNAVLRQYVDCVLPSDIAKLPADCQEVLANPFGDVHATAVVLLHAELKTSADSETGALLRELAHTFAAASVRLTQMQTISSPTLPPKTQE